jgi:hypothetical protein
MARLGSSLSLSDLESEFERALRSLRASGRVGEWGETAPDELGSDSGGSEATREAVLEELSKTPKRGEAGAAAARLPATAVTAQTSNYSGATGPIRRLELKLQQDRESVRRELAAAALAQPARAQPEPAPAPLGAFSDDGSYDDNHMAGVHVARRRLGGDAVTRERDRAHALSPAEVERKMLMQSFLHRRKIQEARLKEEMRVDDLVDSSLTNEVLLAELRGIQFEIDEFARLRTERARLRQSTPGRLAADPAPQPHVASGLGGAVNNNGGSNASSGARLRSGQSERLSNGRGPVEDQRQIQSHSRSQSRSISSGSSVVGGARGSPTAPRSPAAASQSDDVDALEGLFAREDQDLHAMVRGHYDALGRRDIDRVGRELAARRKSTLLELRAELENRNAAYVAELEAKQSAEVEAQREVLRREADERLQRQVAELEARGALGPEARQATLAAYAAELDAAVERRVAARRVELEQQQLEELEALSQRRLAESEERIRAEEAVLAREHAARSAAALADLSTALDKGAHEALAAARQAAEAAAADEITAVRARCAERARVAEEHERRVAAERRAARVAEAEAAGARETEDACAALRARLDERLLAELADRSAAAAERRGARLAEVRAEAEQRAASELASLEASLASDAREAASEVEAAARERLDRALEDAREDATRLLHTAAERNEAELARRVREAREAFHKWLSAATQTAAGHRGASGGDGDDDDESDDDHGLDTGSRAGRLHAPKRLSATAEGERQVHALLDALLEAHRETTAQLRRCQQQLAKAGKETVLARSAASSGAITANSPRGSEALRKELADSKKLVQKLFAANQALKAEAQQLAQKQTSSKGN